MKTLMMVLLAATLGPTTGCGGGSEPEEPRERLEKPYEDRVKEIEAEQLRRAREQMEEADRQSGGGNGGPR